MKMSPPASSLRALVFMTAGVVLASAVFITALQQRFGLPSWVIPAHLLLVLGIIGMTVLVLAALHPLLHRRPALLVMPLALVLTALWLVDVTNWVGRDAWMDEISLRIMLAYAPRVFDIAIAATADGGPWLLAGAVLGVVALIAAVLRSARPITDAIAHLVSSDGLGVLGRAAPSVVALTLVVAGGGLLGATYAVMKDRTELTGEPITGLFPGATMQTATVRRHAALLPERVANGPASLLESPAGIEVVPGRKDVVIIVLDSLRADHLRMFGYARSTMPNLDAFVADAPAIVADWATSTCSVSECGIVSLLASAQYHHQGGDLRLLPDVLGAAGYDSYVISSGDFTQAYSGLHKRLGSTARMFVDGFTSPDYKPNDDRSVLAALETVPPRGERPAFFYIHLHSIHRIGLKFRDPVWHPAITDTTAWTTLRKLAGLPTTPAHGAAPELLDYDTVDKTALAINDYDNGIVQADDVVAAIVRALRVRGYLERSVVVVTADHGEGLGEHGHFGHAVDLHGESIDVPLVVRDPTFTASRRVPYARQIDVAPTILACLGLDPPTSWEGRSLLSGAPTESFHQTTAPRPSRAVIWRTSNGTYKYIFDSRTREESLFVLDRDRGEQANAVATADPRVLALLRSALATNFETTVPGTTASTKRAAVPTPEPSPR